MVVKLAYNDVKVLEVRPETSILGLDTDGYGKVKVSIEVKLAKDMTFKQMMWLQNALISAIKKGADQ